MLHWEIFVWKATSGHDIASRSNEIIQIKLITKQTVVVVFSIRIHVDAQLYWLHVARRKVFAAEIIIIVARWSKTALMYDLIFRHGVQVIREIWKVKFNDSVNRAQAT